MKELVGKGLLGQVGVAGILVILILQIILPYVSGDPKASETNNKSNSEIISAINYYQEKVATLTQLNKQQCESDKSEIATHEKQIEALAELSKAVAILANSTSALQKTLDRLEARRP